MKLARLNCGATGVDVGWGYGLFVSAQDNDLGLDKISTDPNTDPPWENAPVPGSVETGVVRMTIASIAWMEGWSRDDEGDLRDGNNI